MAITQTLTAPGTPPQRSDPANFPTRADSHVVWQATQAVELVAWTAQANTLASEVNADEVAADASRVAAQAAQAAAEAVVAAAAWSSVTAYVAGNCVYGTDGHTYRAIASSTNVNPVGDLTAKWVRITSPGINYSDISAGSTLIEACYRIAAVGTYTLPASPSTGLCLEIAIDCTPTSGTPVTFARNGKTIEGSAADLTVEDATIGRFALVYNGTTWRVRL